MWYIIQSEEWERSVKILSLPLFFDIEYINSITKTTGLKVSFYCFKKKNRILALGAVYSQSNKIVLPEHFSYTPLWFISDISEINYFEILNSFIKELKVKFKEIELKLPTQFTDVRPFIWEYFKVENKYTYMKKDNLPPHYSVEKNLSKLELGYYTFCVEDVNISSIKINLSFLKELKTSDVLMKKYNKFLIEWAELGILKSFNLYKDDVLLCSNIAFIDEKTGSIYTILLNKVDQSFKYAHTYLYSSIISWAKENDFKTVDFCGANMLSISKFKSSFNMDLVPYFVVKYSLRMQKAERVKTLVKDSIKRFL